MFFFKKKRKGNNSINGEGNIATTDNGDAAGRDMNKTMYNITYTSEKGLINQPDKSKRDVKISVNLPSFNFPVTYYLLHVKDGQDEWLPKDQNMPLNYLYCMTQNPDNPNIYSATVSTVGNLGFQFKCYAECSSHNRQFLIKVLIEHFGYSSNNIYQHERGDFKRVTQGSYDEHVWFCLPKYHPYVTSDITNPFLNNYYHHAASAPEEL